MRSRPNPAASGNRTTAFLVHVERFGGAVPLDIITLPYQILVAIKLARG